MLSLSIPGLRGSLPWFIYDLSNYQLITSVAVPEGDIKDRKDIVLVETPIPGRNFQPLSAGGNGNRKVSFRIPIVQRNNTIGNMLLIKQFDMLRNQSPGLFGLGKTRGQFTPNPKVLYSWGTGSVPLEYYVSKCEFAHRADMVNAAGAPTVSYVDMELILDETSPLYKAEEAFRNVSAALGSVQGAAALVQSYLPDNLGGGNPF